MMQGIPIRVAVIFEPGKKAMPVWFQLNRRQHKVLETTYFWKDKVGETPLFHYAVTYGEALYKLIFSPVDQSWTLYRQQTE